MRNQVETGLILHYLYPRANLTVRYCRNDQEYVRSHEVPKSTGSSPQSMQKKISTSPAHQPHAMTAALSEHLLSEYLIDVHRPQKQEMSKRLDHPSGWIRNTGTNSVSPPQQTPKPLAVCIAAQDEITFPTPSSRRRRRRLTPSHN